MGPGGPCGPGEPDVPGGPGRPAASKTKPELAESSPEHRQCPAFHHDISCIPAHPGEGRWGWPKAMTQLGRKSRSVKPELKTGERPVSS